MLPDQWDAETRPDVFADKAVAQAPGLRLVVHQPGVGEHAGDRVGREIAPGRRPFGAAGHEPHVEHAPGLFAGQIAAGAFGDGAPARKGGRGEFGEGRSDSSEERREGKEGGSTCRARWAPLQYKK